MKLLAQYSVSQPKSRSVFIYRQTKDWVVRLGEPTTKSEGVDSCSANCGNSIRVVSHIGFQPSGVIRSSADVAGLRSPATVEVVESTYYPVATMSPSDQTEFE